MQILVGIVVIVAVWGWTRLSCSAGWDRGYNLGRTAGYEHGAFLHGKARAEMERDLEAYAVEILRLEKENAILQ